MPSLQSGTEASLQRGCLLKGEKERENRKEGGEKSLQLRCPGKEQKPTERSSTEIQAGRPFKHFDLIGGEREKEVGEQRERPGGRGKLEGRGGFQKMRDNLPREKENTSKVVSFDREGKRERWREKLRAGSI